MSTTVEDLALVTAHLPEGWTVDNYTPGKSCDHLIVKAAGHIGCVTLDLGRRGFRLGIKGFGPTAGDTKYTGHGWRERLVDDAVAALRGPEVKP